MNSRWFGHLFCVAPQASSPTTTLVDRALRIHDECRRGRTWRIPAPDSGTGDRANQCSVNSCRFATHSNPQAWRTVRRRVPQTTRVTGTEFQRHHFAELTAKAGFGSTASSSPLLPNHWSRPDVILAPAEHRPGESKLHQDQSTRLLPLCAEIPGSGGRNLSQQLQTQDGPLRTRQESPRLGLALELRSR